MKKETKRNCYCNSIDDKFREKNGIPKGYCGICEICNKAGHTQHFPGAVPYTGAWCDECLKVIKRRYKIKMAIFFMIFLGVLLSIFWQIAKILF